MSDQSLCVFCNQSLENTGENASLSVVTLPDKGSASINKASHERGEVLCTVPGQKVHSECRRVYCNPNKIIQAKRHVDETPEIKKRTLLRSAESGFSFKDDCLFCGTGIIGDDKLKRGVDFFAVTTLEMKDTVLLKCDERGDDWSNTIKARLLNIHDLPAADAIYHQACSVHFRTGRNIPKKFGNIEPKQKKPNTGRPEDKNKAKAFSEVVRYLEENDDEKISVNDLIAKMEEYLEGTDSAPYSRTHMNTKLKEKFGNQVIITEINGKPNVVTFRSTAQTVLQQFHTQQRNEPQMEKKNIISAAAKLIRDDIKGIQTTNDQYPQPSELESEEKNMQFLPESLLVFLQELFSGKNNNLKLAAIGQALMQATRPRVLMTPLQIGLAVQLHHHFASRFLIDSLHAHGFCSSYQETQKFDQCAAVDEGTDIPRNGNEHIEYAADNVDHDIRTLDGKDTFHGMGIIAMSTPGVKHSRPVPRKHVNPEDLRKTGQIQIHYHHLDPNALAHITYNELTIREVTDPTRNLDVLWKSSLLFGSVRPSWSGMMQHIHQDSHPGKSSVTFLPMIDMNSSDATCIYSTLKYVTEHASKHGSVPVLTFDQPLWFKALQLIEGEPTDSPLHQIVLPLGGFHTQMSFLACIGHLMAGSGLQELLEYIYAPKAVGHICSGKAVSRAVRAHFIVDSALNTLLLSEAMGVEVPNHQQNEDLTTGASPDDADYPTQHSSSTTAGTNQLQDVSNADITKAKSLFEDLISKNIHPAECASEKTLQTLSQHLSTIKMSFQDNRTARLWLQYMDMVDILRMFLKAERTGNWELHLFAVSQMLPYLAAAGHNLYTKSLQIYLQQMSRLSEVNVEIHRAFMNGHHVIRRSDRQWAGLSTDLVIEQVLMRSLKTSGGLTRGRGMKEQQRLIWLLSMPARAEVNRAMQDLTRVTYSTSEQNKEMTKSRQLRDMKDTNTTLFALQDRNPFCTDQDLRNIMTGVTANASVNVDEAREQGEQILSSMHGQSVTNYKFKRQNQANTLAFKSTIKIDGQLVQVDPQLLFQRLVIACKSSEEKEEYFKYELCTFPTSLFEYPGLPRAPQKSALADALWSFVDHENTSIPLPEDAQYVLDGGALLHRIPWPKGYPTYRELCQIYCDYVSKRYGSPIIVFDGYTNPSTKDITHQRRASGKVVPQVNFTDEMKVTIKKEQFLSNTTNKQNLIIILAQYLDLHNCKTIHAEGDADLLITQTVIESANTKDTVLIGDDTDLLVLLTYHVHLDAREIFFHSEPKGNTQKQRTWNLKHVKMSLNLDVTENMLFIHAILGCDITSRIYGIGKSVSLKKFMKNEDFRRQAKIFDLATSTRDEIITAGEKALLFLYNDNDSGSINTLRFKRFCEKVASKNSHVKPQTLPPTSAAATYHSLRVFYQVQEWKGFPGGVLNALEWGWQSVDGCFVPLMTDLPPAPDNLMKVIHCNCKSDCSSMRCTCRKNNLLCSHACGRCNGTACSNALSTLEDSDTEDNI